MKITELNHIDERNLIRLFVANPIIFKIEELLDEGYTEDQVLKMNFSEEIQLSIQGYFSNINANTANNTNFN